MAKAKAAEMIMKKYRVADALTDKFKAGGVEILYWNGHYKNGDMSIFRPGFNPFDHFHLMGREMDNETLDKIDQSLESNTPLDEWLPIGDLGYSLDCTYCSEKLKIETNGELVRITNACPRPNGITNVKGEINCTSGKLAFANDLRDLFPVSGSFDVNGQLGTSLTIEEYLKVGMAHGFCGNTCPGVYRTSPERVTISNGPGGGDFEDWLFDHDEAAEKFQRPLISAWHETHKDHAKAVKKLKTIEDAKKKEHDKINKIKDNSLDKKTMKSKVTRATTKERRELKALVEELEAKKETLWKEKKEKLAEYAAKSGAREKFEEMKIPGERVGGICTDLWWYSVVDVDELKERYKFHHCEHGKSNPEDVDEWLEGCKGSIDIVDVKPGVYKYVHDMDARQADDDGEDAHYGIFEWDREPDPKFDYVGRERNTQVTVGQMFASKVGENSYCCEIFRGEPKGKDEDELDWMVRRVNKYVPYDDMTEAEQLSVLSRIADSTMFHTRWDDWHPNGWCAGNGVDGNSPSIDVPEFKGQLFGSYGIGYSTLCRNVGMKDQALGLPEFQEDFNESFAQLAFNILQNIIRYGFKPSDRGPDEAATNLALAKRAYLYYCERYPNYIPDYCDGLLKELKDAGVTKRHRKVA